VAQHPAQGDQQEIRQDQQSDRHALFLALSFWIVVVVPGAAAGCRAPAAGACGTAGNADTGPREMLIFSLILAGGACHEQARSRRRRPPSRRHCIPQSLPQQAHRSSGGSTVKKQPILAAVLAASAVSAAVAAAPALAADGYPSKPIRVIVPFAPGGSTDIIARLVTQRMSQELGQPMVVENKGGAGGAIGAAEAARAEPDGYTLSIATVSTMAVNPACRPKDLPYDPIKDFQPVTNFANTANVIAANPKFPAKDFKSFLQELRDNPGKYSYGSSGTCGVLHLFGEAFKLSTKTDIVHVPYKGSGPAIADTVGGQIELIFDNLPSSMPQIQAGKLRALAVAWPDRIANLKDVPTLAEAGFPELNQPVWYGLLAPAGTSADIVNKLRDAAVIALKDPKVIQVLDEQGSSPSGNTPEEFAKEIQSQYDWARDVVKKQNITLE